MKLAFFLSTSAIGLAACSPAARAPQAPTNLTSATAAAAPTAKGYKIESVEFPGQCVSARGGTGPTAVVTLIACDDVKPALQRIAYDGHSLRIGESCISRAGEFTGAGQGGSMQLWSCDAATDPNPMTRIEPLDVTLDDDHIRVTGTQRCLFVEPKNPDSPGFPRLVLEPCGDVPGQKWRVTNDVVRVWGAH